MVSEEVKRVDAKKVNQIVLVIGDLSTILDESVQMYFDFISAGTAVEGAKLIFERVPAQFYCPNCVINFVKSKVGFECPTCKTLGNPTEIGREFYIKSIEVD